MIYKLTDKQLDFIEETISYTLYHKWNNMESVSYMTGAKKWYNHGWLEVVCANKKYDEWERKLLNQLKEEYITERKNSYELI